MRISSFVCVQLALVILCSTAVADLGSAISPDQPSALPGPLAEGDACLVNCEGGLNACCSQTQPSTCGYGDTCCCSSGMWMRPCRGVFGDVELLLLRWTDTDGDDSQSTAQSAARYTLGYVDCSGRSFRARYFDFSAPDQDGAGTFTTSRLDLEYSGRFSSATIGTARQSFQFGTEQHEDHDSVFGIAELGAGLEVSRSYRASRLFFRSGVEVQHYTSVRDDEEDYGLVGLSLRCGLRR